MIINIKAKESIPSACPYESGMAGGVSLKNFLFRAFQNTDGTIVCNSCGRTIGWSKKKIDNTTIRDDNVCP